MQHVNYCKLTIL